MKNSSSYLQKHCFDCLSSPCFTSRKILAFYCLCLTWSKGMSLDIRRSRLSSVSSLASFRTISIWSSSLFSSSSLICLRYLSLSMRLWEKWCWASSLARNAWSSRAREKKQQRCWYLDKATKTSVWKYEFSHLVPFLLHLIKLRRDCVNAVPIHLTVLLKCGALQLKLLLLLQVLHTQQEQESYSG